ncbi:MAG: DUF2892 domain-containing protein [Parvularculaceae bacterium]
MKFANMGSADRIIRFIVGAALLAAVFLGKIDSSTPLGIGAIIVGAVFVLTAVFAFCPAYLPFGLKTNKKKEA